MNCPSKTLQNAVDAISSLPGVGSRSALRLALHLLKQPEENVRAFASAIDKLTTDIHYCRQCSMVCDDELCPICSDSRRDNSKICVVESVRDVMSIEQTGQYNGLYHVLGGVISPMDGVAPSDLTIDELVNRVDKTGPAEVILAIGGDVEGETTAFYIYRKLQSSGCLVSTLARGIGFGDDLEYADSVTLGRSILERKAFSL